MTKTWLWFRVESNTESKNGRKFRPDTETKVSKSRKKKYGVKIIPAFVFFGESRTPYFFFRDLLTIIKFYEFITHLWLLDCRKNAPKVGIRSQFHLHHHHSQDIHHKFWLDPNTFGKKKEKKSINKNF